MGFQSGIIQNNYIIVFSDIEKIKQNIKVHKNIELNFSFLFFAIAYFGHSSCCYFASQILHTTSELYLFRRKSDDFMV